MALQLDLCFEVTSLEYARGRLRDEFFKPYFSPIYDGLLSRIQRMVAHIPANVPLGIHPCYGDLNHAHFIEPDDMGMVVDFVNGIAKTTSHTIDWIHLAVPKSRDDPGYFAPLARLHVGTRAKLFLGLVHFDEEEGTRRRIHTAQTVVKDFGVATEYGFERTPAEQLSSLLQISRDVTVGVDDS